MPAPGDQHRPSAVTANPFEDKTTKVSTWTAREIATLQSRLEKQLGPEYISSRPGPSGGKIHYLAGEKAINLANEVFGFNGWSSQIQNVQVDFVDENPNNGTIKLGLSIIVRVTLRDGTFHEDIGYGHIENCKGKAAAFEKAKKEAATDALKRALRNFGSVLGNCLYDKEYLSKIAKVKPPQSKWEVDNLYRHHDFAPPKKEQEVKLPPLPNGAGIVSNGTDQEDEFGGDLFDDADLPSEHPEEIEIMDVAEAGDHSRAQQRNLQNGHTAPTHQPRPSGPKHNLLVPNPHLNPQAAPPTHAMAHHVPNPTLQRPSHSTPPNHDISEPTALPEIGFTTSRNAALLNANESNPSILAAIPKFDPHAESPSIRKTIGVNHNASKPIARSVIAAGATGTTSPVAPRAVPAQTTNFINPAADHTRRIGMPAGAPSPLGARTSAYKPQRPGVGADSNKRPFSPAPVLPAEGAVGDGTAVVGRAPLADLSNTAGRNAVSGGEEKSKIGDEHGREEEAKRIRVGQT